MSMAELTQTEVYAPRTVQVWRALLNWLAFFFQIFVRFFRGKAQLLSYVGIGRQSLLGSDSTTFKPLPVVELLELEEPAPAVEIAREGDDVHENDNEQRLEKLTSCLLYPNVPETRSVPVCGTGMQNVLPYGIRYNGYQQKMLFYLQEIVDYSVWLVVVLDLDETLVCAYETSSLPATVRNQATKAGLKWFELECVSSDKEFEGKPKINYVTVFERPGLDEFMRQLSGFAELVLFTAGLEGYARPLVDRIDSENRFSRRLYRPSTCSTEYREHVKDLCCISKDLERVVIVDNNPFSFLLQPTNGIPCIPFSAGQPHDEQLLEVLLPLLRHLAQQKDVRHFLYERFHMPEWFKKHGIPSSAWTEGQKNERR